MTFITRCDDTKWSDSGDWVDIVKFFPAQQAGGVEMLIMVHFQTCVFAQQVELQQTRFLEAT